MHNHDQVVATLSALIHAYYEQAETTQIDSVTKAILHAMDEAAWRRFEHLKRNGYLHIAPYARANWLAICNLHGKFTEDQQSELGRHCRTTAKAIDRVSTTG